MYAVETRDARGLLVSLDVVDLAGVQNLVEHLKTGYQLRVKKQ